MAEVPGDYQGRMEVPVNQPLDRRHVTEGSVVILVAYPVTFVCIGLLFLLQGSQRFSGPAFDAARACMPIHAWGCVFLTVGLVEAAALIGGEYRQWSLARTVYRYSLVVGAGVTGFWGGLLAASAIASPIVSFTGAIWLGFATVAHIASVRSLTRDTVIKP